MRVVAYVWCFDEADIIGHVVDHLCHEGVWVHIFDNWSSDDSIAVATQAAVRARRPVEIEKWPKEPPTTASWRAMLQHTANVAREQAQLHGAHWALHHDADEFRMVDSLTETLHDFLYRIRLVGWNAVDHKVSVFAPRDGYDPAIHHPLTHFGERLADHIDAHNGQTKAWWQTPDVTVDLASSGGHDVRFPGRKVCPEKLLLYHYPMRGEKQREAKARSRAERWDRAERAMGWHAQYAQ